MIGVPSYRPDNQMTYRQKSREAEDIAFEARKAVAAVEKAIAQPGNAHRDNHRPQSTCDKLFRQSLLRARHAKSGCMT